MNVQLFAILFAIFYKMSFLKRISLYLFFQKMPPEGNERDRQNKRLPDTPTNASVPPTSRRAVPPPRNPLNPYGAKPPGTGGGLPNGGHTGNLQVPEIRYGPQNALYQGRNRPAPRTRRHAGGIPNTAFEPDFRA